MDQPKKEVPAEAEPRNLSDTIEVKSNSAGNFPSSAFTFKHPDTPTGSVQTKPPSSFSGDGRVLYLPGIPEEEYPESLFFSPEFQMGLLYGKQLAQQSATILSQLLSRQRSAGGAERSPQRMADLTDGLMRASQVEFSTAKTIAFLGNSGEGKGAHCIVSGESFFS